ncbi:GntR family transcriptional regulator [Ornithinimicrobium sp. Arc0846-15]|nr:GntR family transcriptional regulator [Ornithinimicrobium laminariae]
MFTIDVGSSIPVFQQVADCVTRGVKTGAVAPWTKLPSVRGLAEELGIAANTVAKAYRQLETEGHVETRGRNGTVVLDPPDAAESAASAAAVTLAALAKEQGLTLDATLGLLRRQW